MRKGELDPTGKRALFEAPVAAAEDRIAPGELNDGKAALFSLPPRRTGTVVVQCSGCKVRSRASFADLGARLAAGSVWLPWRDHPHWMRCPSCRRRQWCQISWTA